MSLYENLRAALADTTAMYFMAHSCHWNVRGDDFPQLHEFFGEIYADVYGAVDPLAEHIRAQGGLAPVSLADICADTTLEEMQYVEDATGMLKRLQAANEKVLSSLEKAYDATEKAYGLQNYLAERIDAHAKWGWQLTATLEDDGDD